MILELSIELYFSNISNQNTGYSLHLEFNQITIKNRESECTQRYDRRLIELNTFCDNSFDTNCNYLWISIVVQALSF